jgi:peptidoglycan/xylan/chitin deacetylase (PgdA/CDA1 family)
MYRFRVPVLMYHEVSSRTWNGFEKYVVAPQNFDSQMSEVVRAGFRAISLDTLIAARSRPDVLPKKPIVITFDDGFRDCLSNAAPILQKHGLTATFFLVPGLMGGESEWLARERGLRIPMASWADARALVAAGFECGSHSMTHPRFTELTSDQCALELTQSRIALQNELSTSINHFAYPFGLYSEDARAAVESSGYSTACSVRIGFSGPDDDRFALHRVPINGTDTLPEFRRKLTLSLARRLVARFG